MPEIELHLGCQSRVETKTKTHAVGSFEQSCVQHFHVVTSIVDQVHQRFIIHLSSRLSGIYSTVVLYRNSIGIGHSTACRVHHEPRRSETAQTADVLNSSPDSYQCVVSAYLSYSHELVPRNGDISSDQSDQAVLLCTSDPRVRTRSLPSVVRLSR